MFSQNDEKKNPKKQKIGHTPNNMVPTTTNPVPNNTVPNNTTSVTQNTGTKPFMPKPRALMTKTNTPVKPRVVKPIGFPFFPPTSELPIVNNTVSNENNTPISTTVSKPTKEEEKAENKMETQVTTTNVPPVKQNEYLQLIGRIAHFISQIPCDNDFNLLARYYGLVLIGKIADEVPIFVGSKNAMSIGKQHNFTNLPQTLDDSRQIRNSIADFFIRIKDHSFIMGCDPVLNDFSQLDTINGQAQARLFTFAQCNKQANEIHSHRNITVKKIDRLAYFINALKLINVYSTMDQNLSSDVTTFAISMLYVIAGTCARELLGFLGERKDDDRDLQNIAKIFHEMRDNTFAHFYITGKDTAKFKQSIIKTNLTLIGMISKLEAEIPYAEFQFSQTYDKSVAIQISGLTYPTGSISANIFDPDLSLCKINKPLEVNNTTAIQVVN